MCPMTYRSSIGTEDGTLNRYPRTINAWLYGIALLLVLVIAACGIFFPLSHYFGQGELGTKSYYASLQGVEFDNRGSKDPNPILDAR